MATIANLNRKIQQLIDTGVVYPEMTREKLVLALTRASKHWQVKDFTTGKFRPWGAGENEETDDMVSVVSTLFFREKNWPDCAPLERANGQYYQCHPRYTRYAKFMDDNVPGVLDRFFEIRNSRSMSSPYYFDDMEFYFNIMSNNNYSDKVFSRNAPWWHTLKTINPPQKLMRKAALLVAAYMACGNVHVNRGVSANLAKEFANSGEYTFGTLEYVRITGIHDLPLAQKLRNLIPADIAALIVKNGVDVSNVQSYQRTRGGAWISEALNAGIPPATILRDWLPPKMAHKYCMANLDNRVASAKAAVLEYLFPKYPEELQNAIRGLKNLTPLLVQWLVNKGKNKSLYKDRIVYGPAGAVRHFNYIAVLDELTDADLVNGIKTSVDVAFQSSAKRLELEMRAEMGESVPLLELQVDHPDPRIVQIKDSGELAVEGLEMEHCVFGYKKYCIHGKTTIWRVRNGDERATMEVSLENNKWTIWQVQGRQNTVPSSILLNIVAEWATKNKIELKWERN